MAYVSKTDVRYRLSLDEFKPSDAILDNLIEKAETELKTILGGSLTYATIIKQEENPVNKISINNFKSIESVTLDGKTIKEFSDSEILINQNVETMQNDEVQAWNESEGTGDTLSQDKSNSYIYTHSLKIAKGAAVNSYWYSDAHSVSETYYKASARINVDANTEDYTYLKLEFLDTDESIVKTYTSEAISMQITQPTSASVVACVSASATDTNQAIIIRGVANNKTIIEAIQLTGTDSVNSTKEFSEIIEIKKSSATAGTITLTSNSAAVTNATLTANQNEKSKWIEAEITGSPTEDSNTMRVSFYVSSTATSGAAYADNFQLKKQNWFTTIDGIHFNDKKAGLYSIDYEQAQLPELIRELLRDLTVLFVMINLNGADTSGINYDALKSAQFQLPSMIQLYARIYASFRSNLQAYQNIYSADFI